MTTLNWTEFPREKTTDTETSLRECSLKMPRESTTSTLSLLMRNLKFNYSTLTNKTLTSSTIWLTDRDSLWMIWMILLEISLTLRLITGCWKTSPSLTELISTISEEHFRLRKERQRLTKPEAHGALENARDPLPWWDFDLEREPSELMERTCLTISTIPHNAIVYCFLSSSPDTPAFLTSTYGSAVEELLVSARLVCQQLPRHSRTLM